MKKSHGEKLKNSFKNKETNSNRCDENGDHVYNCAEEVENDIVCPLRSNAENACNKMSFKRKNSFFKVLPWKWSRNPKNKRSETNRCGVQENLQAEFSCSNNCSPKESSKGTSSTPEDSEPCLDCIILEGTVPIDRPSCSDYKTNPHKYKRRETEVFVPYPTDNLDIPSALMSGSNQEQLRIGSLTQELSKLSKCGWYWGPISRREADEKLVDQPNGAFLVRDSSDDRHLLSLSFRSCGQTLHTRIEHSNGLFSFYTPREQEGHASVVELIGQSVDFSQSGVYCYSRSRSPGAPSYPVRLTKPVSRFTQVRSLRYLCRFVIRQHTRYDHLQALPLPAALRGYLQEGHY